MYKYFISLLFVLSFYNSFSQEIKDPVEKDSVVYKTAYGLRLGADLSKPVRGVLQNFYQGYELVGDYRISEKWYIAAEIGFEEFTSKEDFLNVTSKGNYARIGVNYNSYKNWLDMNNEIFVGFRYGISLFEQTLNSYSVNVGNSYLPSNEITPGTTFDGLSAHWGEFVVGLKAEIFDNIFMGVSGSFRMIVNVQDPENFQSLFAPGFNRIYTSNTGFGFNYTISYLIPFTKK